MNLKDLGDDNTLYVAKFEKKANRWAALKKSLARANLYVRNFDKNVTEEDLKQFFGGEGVVRNVRIMTTEVSREDGVHKESKQFGFVSFTNPKDAFDIMQKYQTEDLEFNNKQLYVNYYEDKGARKKRLASSKKDNLMGILDQSMNGGNAGGDNTMMEYFMQIFQQYFKQNMQGGGQGFGNQQYSNNYNNANQYNKNYEGDHYTNRRHRRPNRGSYNQYNQYNQGQQNMYNRPRQDVHNSYATASPAIPSSAPPMVGQMPPAPVSGPALVSHPPVAGPPVAGPPVAGPPTSTGNQGTLYLQTVGALMNSPEFISLSEDGKREKIGEEIYNYVLQKAGDESAPKITGMIIDLPFNDLLTSVKSWEGLQEKVQEGLDLLQDDQ
mmetsp:Transcript_2774/g.3238  ORF Transcript_2774/g.3238 Transcript_2774/m.3238 type:complete len:381 (+) Transcript_2774:23-1165(+)